MIYLLHFKIIRLFFAEDMRIPRVILLLVHALGKPQNVALFKFIVTVLNKKESTSEIQVDMIFTILTFERTTDMQLQQCQLTESRMRVRARACKPYIG